LVTTNYNWRYERGLLQIMNSAVCKSNLTQLLVQSNSYFDYLAFIVIPDHLSKRIGSQYMDLMTGYPDVYKGLTPVGI